MIEARQIVVAGSGRPRLDGVSLRIVPGEIVVAVGPNGAGKSTLLRTLCGEVRQQSGSIEVDGRGLETHDRGSLARRRAVLLQEVPLRFPFTVAEVVQLGRSPHGAGRTTATDRRIVGAALEALDLGELGRRFYPTLSGGERQRVQLARVLAQIWEAADGQQRYLLLDEPTASFDPAHQHQALSLVRTFARAGVGVLVVLHDLSLARAYADRVAILQAGRLYAEGTAAKVLCSNTVDPAFGVQTVVAHGPSGETYLIPTGVAIHQPPRSSPAKGNSSMNLQVPSPTRQALAVLLRERTAEAHRSAERVPFVTALLRGEIDRSTYASFLARLHDPYAALEAGLRRHRSHPVLRQIYFPELERRAAIERDLDHLHDGTWSGAFARTPAARAYADRIHDLAEQEPELLVAHAYTRYLGDLSGGQVMARQLRKHLGIEGEAGLEFFSFPGVPDVDAFKVRYRAALDCLPLDASCSDAVVAEAQRAFAFNQAIAEEVWQEAQKGVG